MDNKEKIAIIEGILFASGEPLSIERLCIALDESKTEILKLIEEMKSLFEFERRGIAVAVMNNNVQLCTRSEYAEYIRRAIEIRKPSALSQSALEVLSIIAYKQPVTKAYIEQIRGVDSSHTVNMLCDKGIVESCGKLDVIGKPTLFRTTIDFLRIFGIRNLHELPELPELDGEFEQLKL